jgi:predicted nuclease with TOPRIM domain
MLSPDLLKDLHEIGTWLFLAILSFLGLVIRTIFTNKAQIDLLKKELQDRFQNTERHDEEMRTSLNRLEKTVESTREQILELWKQKN